MEWIYDRTEDDVIHARELNEKYISGTITDIEKEEWLAGLKGAFNVSDINRIEGNTSEVADYISKEVAWLPRSLIVTKEWSGNDIPRVSDYFRILRNIQLLRSSWFTIPSTPETPSQPLNHYEKINDIEHILHDLYRTYVATTRSYDYCGEFYAGEEVGAI